jgi:alpha-tubulin suppressor-like RCC1 family protein
MDLIGITIFGGVNIQPPPPPPAPIYLWAWGGGGSGRLGLGNTTYYSSPKQVGALNTWSSVAAGLAHSLAIKTDGTLWSWGINSDGYGEGQLGLGNLTSYSSPKQVGALTTWSNISIGWGHNLAIRTDGTLWSWGVNGYGQTGLGDAPYSTRSSPTQIGSSAWSKISGGQAHSLAITTSGTLWAWGKNGYGRLGVGDTVNRSNPTQVGGLTTWASVAAGHLHSIAIKTDGTIWSWGEGTEGILGLGNSLNKASPNQIGALTNWLSVAAGYSTLAIKTDGTLWSWGRNFAGMLGLGDGTVRSSPVQVAAGTTWTKVSHQRQHTLAIKTDNTLWSWGSNSYGRLGLGDTTTRASPIQIGTSTNWSSISAGYNHSLAVG